MIHLDPAPMRQNLCLDRDQVEDSSLQKEQLELNDARTFSSKVKAVSSLSPMFNSCLILCNTCGDMRRISWSSGSLYRWCMTCWDAGSMCRSDG